MARRFWIVAVAVFALHAAIAASSVLNEDGQCAFAAAVLEMMAHEVNGKTEFFKGCPPEWKDVSFENIALSDGRRASGRRLDGKAKVTYSHSTRSER